MTRLIEDIITNEEYEAVERVLSSLEFRFDRLAILAGLDPTQDFKYSDLRTLNFCGADLRGYDFTGSDLRDCAIDVNTKIDETTVLTDAEVRWIDEGDLPIVQLMMDVSHASSSDNRAHSLAKLEERFGKTDHVIQFVVNAASETDNLDCYLDYLDFLPASLPARQTVKLVEQGERVLRKRLSRARARTGRDATKIFAISMILDRLRESSDSFAEAWYENLALTADDLTQTQALQGTVIEPKEELLVSSLRKLTKAGRKSG